MNLVLMIIQIAVEILIKQQIGGAAITYADELVDIISKAKADYERQVGRPLDVLLIKPYTPIP